MKEVKLPEETLNALSAFGFKGQCFRRSLEEEVEIETNGSWRIRMRSCYTFALNVDKAQCILWIALPSPDEDSIHDVMLDFFFGSGLFRKAFESLEGAKEWIKDQNIESGQQLNQILVNGEEFNCSRLEGGPWLFAKLVQKWGLENLLQPMPDSVLAESDINAAKRFLSQLFCFTTLELLGQRTLMFRKLGQDELASQMIWALARSPRYNGIAYAGDTPTWVNYLFEIHPNLEELLIDSCDSIPAPMHYRQPAVNFLIEGSAQLWVESGGHPAYLPTDEALIVDLNVNGEDSGFREIAVNLALPPGQRKSVGSTPAYIAYVCDYGNPGECQAYSRHDGKVLFHVPKGARGEFVIFGRTNNASDQFLAGVAVSNNGEIQFEPFEPDTEFALMPCIWFRYFDECAPSYVAREAATVMAD